MGGNVATIKEVPLFRDSVAGLKENIGKMLKDVFPTHKLYFANKDITIPSEKYIVVKRNVRKGNENGLNLVPTYSYLDANTREKYYVYHGTVSFRIKFHKDDAIDDAFYLKMLLSTDEFHYKWWGGDIYGITRISDVTDDPVVVDFVEWEEGAIFTFECNYLFRHTYENADTIEKIIFSVDNGSGEREGEAKAFWLTLGYDNYEDFLASTNGLYLHVNGDEDTPSGVDFDRDW